MIGKNNPLNVRKSSNEWLGQTGSTRGFCDFQNTDYCVRAAMYLICKTYRLRYGLKTYSQLISRYAPPKENNTAAYISFVCKNAFAHPSDSPFLYPDTRIPMMIHLMSKYEGNEVSTIDCLHVYYQYKKDFKL